MLSKTWRLCQGALLLGIVLMLLAFASCLPQKTQTEGELVYRGPIELAVEPGQKVTGTDILYVGLSDEMAEFIIADMQALKKVGDSLDWEGEPVAGARLQLNLRILLLGQEAVRTGGTISLEILDPVVEAATIPTTGIKFAVPVTYGLKQGEAIPGTSITYRGRDESRGAELDMEGYPYRRVGDSIVWEGKLRDDVGLQLDLRVLFFSEDTLRVGGLATLWLGE